MMAELSPPGFDNMVRPPDQPFLVQIQTNFFVKKVLRLIRTLEPRVIDDRPKCDPGGHQQFGQ